MKRVVLVRLQDNGKQTVGILQVFDGLNKVFECKTLELSDKNNTPRISCIPRGLYYCEPYSSKKYPDHYEVKGVPNRTYILFHEGNFYYQINGCILLGKTLIDINRDRNLDVTHSRDTFSKFKKIIGKERFLLQII